MFIFAILFSILIQCRIPVQTDSTLHKCTQRHMKRTMKKYDVFSCNIIIVLDKLQWTTRKKTKKIHKTIDVDVIDSGIERNWNADFLLKSSFFLLKAKQNKSKSYSDLELNVCQFFDIESNESWVHFCWLWSSTLHSWSCTHSNSHVFCLESSLSRKWNIVYCCNKMIAC